MNTQVYSSEQQQQRPPYVDAYDYRDDMTIASSQCSKFSRRHDVSTFNMINYQSCENCRHLTADNQCVTNMDQNFQRME